MTKGLDELKQIPEQILQGLNELWRELEHERLHTTNLETTLENALKLLDMESDPQEVLDIVKAFISVHLEPVIIENGEAAAEFRVKINKAREYLKA